MNIELAGYTFCNRPISKTGNVFMSNEKGEGTEVSEAVLKEALDMLFQEIM